MLLFKQIGWAMQRYKCRSGWVSTTRLLGKAPIHEESLPHAYLDSRLANQEKRGKKMIPGLSDRFLLGEVLLSAGEITQEQLEDILDRQKVSKKKIGQLFVEAGYLQDHQVNWGLKLQRRLLSTALIASLSLMGVFEGHRAFAGSTTALVSARVNLTATVLERTSMRVVNQARQLVVTDRDILRGYVDIPAASTIAVKSNNPRGYLLMFEVIGGSDLFFDTITVTMTGRKCSFYPEAGMFSSPM